jgi:hypothetical protein
MITFFSMAALDQTVAGLYRHPLLEGRITWRTVVDL